MIMIFFTKKFWLTVFALIVLNYGCNRLAHYGGQTRQTKVIAHDLVQHDIKVKVMSLNSVLEKIRKKSTFEAEVLTECTELRSELFKIKMNAKDKKSTEVQADLKRLDEIEQRVKTLASKLNADEITAQNKQLQTINGKMPENLKRFEEAERNLDRFESNPLLRNFLKN